MANKGIQKGQVATDALARKLDYQCKHQSKKLYERNIKANRKVLTWTIYSKEMADKVKPMCDNITFEGFIPQKHKGEY